MSIPRLVIAAYRPRPEQGDVLLSELRDHAHLLRSEGLATDRPHTLMRAQDGTLIEIFEWASPAAMEQAHNNPRVRAMWDRFDKVCDYVPLNTLAESAERFAEFEPIDIRLPPIIQPEPDARAE